MLKNQMPLVSVLIPTYNRPTYFEIALESAINQTYKNIEIIIADDSTNNETYDCIQPYLKKYNNIFYYKNSTVIGGPHNFINAYEKSNGEYVNFLMDDDMFHPNKIEKMLSYFLEDYTHKITLVTSYRSYIDENGDSIPDTIHNQRRFQQTTVVDGKEAGDSIIAEFNWIGEPTTPLFRKVDLTESFGIFSDRLYRSGVDIAAWLNLLSKGNLLYIPEPLSQLRLHTKNISKSPEMIVNALQDLMHLLFHARKFCFLREKDIYRLALKNIYKLLWLRKNQIQVSEEQNQEINYYILLFRKLLNYHII
ncbi:glycosyltransferase family 2 protein [Bacillus toyonensis]|uniref:glycosyltransferase family 2 protein n=1 Tax=Bacillus toyonensis TaxID=155322 RepID=UPI000BFCA6E4|nr:glycosyltransferase family A protein [Bacillus toyonensis]PHG57694.1 glycosyl transferase family 2 [Bacillus toyonensis]